MNDLQLTKEAIAAATAREKKASMAKQAYTMRMSGAKWWDIAEALGIPETKAKKLVSERIAEVAETIDYYERREFLALELDRLDSLQEAVWGEAMQGKVHAISAILAIMDRRMKWLGMAEPDKTQTVSTQTIVIPGNSKEYIAALQQVRKEIEAA